LPLCPVDQLGNAPSLKRVSRLVALNRIRAPCLSFSACPNKARDQNGQLRRYDPRIRRVLRVSGAGEMLRHSKHVQAERDETACHT
jgi:hypothetical protein